MQFYQTNVLGVFAAGDCASAFKIIANDIFQGSKASYLSSVGIHAPQAWASASLFWSGHPWTPDQRPQGRAQASSSKERTKVLPVLPRWRKGSQIADDNPGNVTPGELEG